MRSWLNYNIHKFNFGADPVKLFTLVIEDLFSTEKMSAMTLSITPSSITTLSMQGLFVTFSVNETQHKGLIL
jgi:hypothetical protein